MNQQNDKYFIRRYGVLNPPAVETELVRIFQRYEKVSFKYQISPVLMKHYHFKQLCDSLFTEMENDIRKALDSVRIEGFEFVTMPVFSANKIGELIATDWVYERVRPCPVRMPFNFGEAQE